VAVRLQLRGNTRAAESGVERKAGVLDHR
jgi:hypothetical protein